MQRDCLSQQNAKADWVTENQCERETDLGPLGGGAKSPLNVKSQPLWTLFLFHIYVTLDSELDYSRLATIWITKVVPLLSSLSFIIDLAMVMNHIISQKETNCVIQKRQAAEANYWRNQILNKIFIKHMNRRTSQKVCVLTVCQWSYGILLIHYFW